MNTSTVSWLCSAEPLPSSQPLCVGEDARSSSGVGKLIGAGVSFSPAIADDLRAALAASAAAKLYDRSEWNDISVSGDIGLTRLADRGSVSGGLRLGQRWIGGDPDHRSLGPWARMGWRLSASTRLRLDVSALDHSYDTRRFLGAWRIAVRPGLRHPGSTGGRYWRLPTPMRSARSL